MSDDNIEISGEHERFMRRCLELARIAEARGATPVGSLVALGNEIIGEGVEEPPTKSDLTGHAEALACQAAVDRTGNLLLHGATLYTTAEPCFMCSYVIRACSVAMVVYGVDTPQIGGVTSSFPILVDASLSGWKPAPRVLSGYLRNECERLRGQ